MDDTPLKDQPAKDIPLEANSVQEQILSLFPPQMRDILRDHFREILAGIVVIVLAALLGTGYNIYSSNRENRAAAALGAAIAERDPDARVEALEKVVKQHRHTNAMHQALLLLGAAERELNDNARAQDAFKKAREAFPGGSVGRVSATMGLAYLYERQGKLQEAQKLFREAGSEKTGYEAVALLDLARVSAKLGKKDQALDACNEYIGQKPESQNMDYVRFMISEFSR